MASLRKRVLPLLEPLTTIDLMAEGDRGCHRALGFKKNENYMGWVPDMHAHAHTHKYTHAHMHTP